MYYMLQHVSGLTEPPPYRLQFHGKWSIQELYLHIHSWMLCISYMISNARFYSIKAGWVQHFTV